MRNETSKYHAALRQQLRELFVAERADLAEDVLESMRVVALGDRELTNEYTRWRLRFDLIGTRLAA